MQTQTNIEAPGLKAPGKAKAPAARKPRTSKPVAARHAAMVDRSGGFFACHPWTGSVKDANGYGQFWAPSPHTGKDSARSAHVVAWELHNGMTVPEGKIVLHNQGCCKTCCNPAHLRLGTHAENAADKVAEKRASRRLTKAEVLEIVMLHREHGVSQAALATRFKADPSSIKNILRGKTHSKLTGIERNVRTGGRPRKIASAVPAPAPLPNDIIILDQRRKPKASADLIAAVH